MPPRTGELLTLLPLHASFEGYLLTGALCQPFNVVFRMLNLRGCLNLPPAGCKEPHHPGRLLDAPAVLMHKGMMIPAELAQVCEARRPTIRPVLDVVFVQEQSMGAAPALTSFEGTSNRSRHRSAGLGSGREPTLHHPHNTIHPTRPFRGNACFYLILKAARPGH